MVVMPARSVSSASHLIVTQLTPPIMRQHPLLVPQHRHPHEICHNMRTDGREDVSGDEEDVDAVGAEERGVGELKG